ncbi:cuticle protein AM1159-like [Macrobrachium nipponense]|uniref:cuticle protein AM1159-like n=1 Tax=Macrobrachium nipponense TaxID=159736 RepID=UPI0030C86203
MKLIVLAAVMVVASAAPSLYTDADRQRDNQAAIVKDERLSEDDGRYNVDVETANGIVLSQSGSPVGESGAIGSAGQYSYTAPDGTVVEMKYVANENGFQPESPFLPVAPEFPHPIPQFVLDQIAFAAEQEARRAREGDSSSRYE